LDRGCGVVKVAKFFASPVGRWLRILLGVALGVIGLIHVPLWLVAVGAVLVIVGAVNVCLLAVLFGGPFNGRKVPRT
jgi:hypothetical protein